MSDGTVVPRLASLRKQLQADAGLSTALNEAFDAIGFTEDDIAFRSGSGKRKAIKDNIWGMLDLSSHEMRLVDSPIVQRLRGIRQLGFSYLIYPSAEHTRFSHSLGMAHVVANLLAGIDRDRTDDNDAFASKATLFSSLRPLDKREVLYASLLHGVGQMPFSRATEAALTSQPALFSLGGMPLQDRLTQLEVALKKNVPLSVGLSVIVILSQRFEHFYRTLEPKLSQDADSLNRIASLVAGTPTVAASPNIQDVISAGAMDANKIDYINRDAAACGVSVGVDLSRIFLGGGLVSAKRSSYDNTYDGGEMASLYVVNASGADTLGEIAQARSALYQRVYLHPLTRAAEAMLAKALVLNAKSTQHRDSALVDALGIWGMDDAELLTRLSRHDDPAVADVGKDLKLRRMPKKACAFSGSLTSLGMPFQQQFKLETHERQNALRKEVGDPFIERLTRERIEELRTTYLEEAIRDEAELLVKALGTNASEHVPSEPLGRIVVTGIAAADSTRPDALILQNGEIVRRSAAPATEEQDAYDVFTAVGYVLCDPAWRQIVFQAARTVIYRESLSRAQTLPFGKSADEGTNIQFRTQVLLDFKGSAMRSNLSIEDARKLASAASAGGYYDSLPMLAPRESIERSEVRRVADLYRSFDGQGGWRIRPSTVAAFADQFPPGLRDGLFDVLLQGTVLDQVESVRLLKIAIAAAVGEGFAQAVLVPLSSSSGGPVVAMLTAELPTGLNVATTIKDSLAFPDRPILLIDDNAVSGTQSAAQLHKFSGAELSTWPVDLQGEDTLFPGLTPEEWEELRTRSFGIAVAVGADAASKRLKAAADELGASGYQGFFCGEILGARLTWPNDLRVFLETVGADLVAQSKFDCVRSELNTAESQSACDHRRFGYGNHGGITVTNHNVPASTVTALWQPGMHEGKPWIPLFIRRGRLKNLIAC
ncbi:HD superfamily phosphohydrolase [Sphingomonas sp. PP-F2F-A104-K0414]|uniref:phosphoribosyltransferase-like protein n=1 Tax=Sphingomonas sp. PP-F2F-A104-K0414 TaxID=2135661 RepID=UPI001045848F|nr:hypothetical protein [Sphingomonas sp. PP-F2F-A104-K0414]TCP96361.1 HD superfamily phosphohydrolase [Sphingomonas sp. PP-F2F-A104-K0414]